MYAVRKAMEYFFPNIDSEVYSEALEFLDKGKREIFLSMSLYDRKHSLEVYKKLKKSESAGKNKKYLELALLHDCGKENTNVVKRILHKIGVKTSLKFHPENGADKLKNIDPELSVLVKNHHIGSYSEEMTEFQKIDDIC